MTYVPTAPLHTFCQLICPGFKGGVVQLQRVSHFHSVCPFNGTDLLLAPQLCVLCPVGSLDRLVGPASQYHELVFLIPVKP